MFREDKKKKDKEKEAPGIFESLFGSSKNDDIDWIDEIEEFDAAADDEY